jgi:glycerol-3-phosphate dehydrogenase (NAD(P)+)
MLLLGRKYVELPISDAVNRVINQGEEPNRVLSGLFLRSIKMEF